MDRGWGLEKKRNWERLRIKTLAKPSHKLTPYQYGTIIEPADDRMESKGWELDCNE